MLGTENPWWAGALCWGRAGFLCPFCYVTHVLPLPLPALACLGYLPLATETSSGPGQSVQDGSLPPASPSPFDALGLDC